MSKERVVLTLWLWACFIFCGVMAGLLIRWM